MLVKNLMVMEAGGIVRVLIVDVGDIDRGMKNDSKQTTGTKVLHRWSLDQLYSLDVRLHGADTRRNEGGTRISVTLTSR